MPKDVAGCPPDYFSPDGQLWGNPLYAWEVHEKTKFAWWVRRIRFAHAQFDSLRIDHFRGFDTYYAIPYGSVNAVTGEWRHGPGMKLFSEVRRQLGDVPIIAEDLGDLCDSVYALLRDSGFPGMKVLQFAFDAPGESEYQPHTYPRNCVAYTGTHDNNTTLGWWRAAPPATKRRAAEYLGLNEKEGFAEGMMRGALQSPLCGASCRCRTGSARVHAGASTHRPRSAGRTGRGACWTRNSRRRSKSACAQCARATAGTEFQRRYFMMNNRIRQSYEGAAAAAGLRFDEESGILYGNRGGYEVVLFAQNARYPYMLTMQVSVQRQGGALTKDEVRALRRAAKPIARVVQTGRVVTVSLKNPMSPGRFVQNVPAAVAALEAFLHERGFFNVCARAANPVPRWRASSRARRCRCAPAASHRRSRAARSSRRGRRRRRTTSRRAPSARWRARSRAFCASSS